MQEKIKALQEIINGARRIVFFGGAGVSTASGIPDFRSQDGLYHQQYAYPPETILSRSFYRQHPEEFYAFYREKMLFLEAEPNAAHLKLAALEQAGSLTAIVTQNIDGLHQKAGSENVLELHGSVLRNYCEACGKFYPVEHMVQAGGVPVCDCGGGIKPDVVLYEEPLDTKTMAGAIAAIQLADVLIIGGTSLVVYPAAGLVDYFKGNKLVIINMSPTHQDQGAHLLIDGNIAEVMDQITV
jgi:NAD-dependent deacetylase